MTSLVKYESARAALMEARRVDEVKDIRDKAIALQAYAKQARDTELIEAATDIRLRAERRAGEMLQELARDGSRASRGGDRRSALQDHKISLADLRITKNQSHIWQKLARLSNDDFEEKISSVKKHISRTLESVAKDKLRREGAAAASSAHVSIFDNIAIVGAGPLADIRFSQLDRLIEGIESDARLLRAIRDFGIPEDRNALLLNVISEAEMRSIAAKCGGRCR